MSFKTGVTRSQDVFQRPSIASSYVANDAINSSPPRMIKFANVVPQNGGGGIILSWKLGATGGSWGPGNELLYLYTKPVTLTIDDTPFLTKLSDNPFWIGVLIGTFTTATPSPTFATFLFTAFPFVCAADENSLYGLMKVSGSPTGGVGTTIINELIVQTK